MITEHVAVCPICDSPESSPHYPQHHIVKCDGCQLIYLQEVPTEKELWDIYQTYAREESHMRLPKTVEDIRTSSLRRLPFWEFLETCEEFPDVINPWYPVFHHLDVGCGWGAFLAESRLRGFTPRGVELTGNAVEFARTILGIPVFQGQMQNLPDHGTLSLVTMLHVIEHLPNTWRALDSVHSRLRHAGIFCGIVPNIDSLMSKKLGAHWGWLDPNYHYIYYTPKTLRSTLDVAGFEVLKLTTRNGDYHKADVEQAAQEAGMSLEEANDRLLGEEIWWIARKRA